MLNRDPKYQFQFLQDICPYLASKKKPIIVAFTNLDSILINPLSDSSSKNKSDKHQHRQTNSHIHMGQDLTALENDFKAFRNAIECTILGKDYEESLKHYNSESNISIHSKSFLPSKISNYANSHSSNLKFSNSTSEVNKYNYVYPPEFIETSSEINVNIDKVFQLACSLVLKKPLNHYNEIQPYSRTFH